VDNRAFFLLIRSLLRQSNSVLCLQCRLIVAQMSDTRCQVLNPFVTVAAFALAAVFMSNDPKVEVSILWSITVAMTLAHIHYGIVVVRNAECKPALLA